jgi:uncharacterized protein YbaR (Trm112 family)
MAEILTCPKCEKKLQVPDQFLGQTVQCPECRHQFVAQQSAVSATPIPAPSSAGTQESGRRRSSRYDEDDEDDDFDVRRGRDDYPRRRRVHHDYAPHRGGLVMALGLVALVGGFAMCVPVIVGPIAWILGTIDLRAMREGRMDPSGEGMTRNGQICGIISTLLLLLGGLFVIFAIMAG